MTTRDAELRRFDSRRKDFNLPRAERAEADRIMRRLYRQTKDSRLEELRSQLFKADQAGDQPAVRRIEREIQGYQLQRGL